ncbi:unnamed protein product [Phyllotreta striolata]|uniref:DNA repair protein RAD50 n=1 Tax=Phyllotreta striolata TaxID=444603 RepID=A0A9N9XNC6_PHYSR|nr:unnamed protein product [Phyllotreta striolata]
MALLHSLEIIGIRNFSPDDVQRIYFQRPVVLFQGQNGSGKTTILECIKFAITGDLPLGTNNGRGFLHDLKIVGKNTLKGSIKIKFRDTDGNMITVSKVLQVQNKNGTIRFSRLNNTVHKRDSNGAPVDICNRNLDVDIYSCSAFKVSKSILNNVLFCHQENSLWPLDEPKQLKEKFDEIFDTKKYNQSIDNVRKYIKDNMKKLPHLKISLEDKKVLKNQAEKQRAKYEDLKEKLKDVEKDIKAKKEQLKPLVEEMKQILKLEDTLGELHGKLTAKEEEKKGLFNQQRNLKDNMSCVFEGSDNELKAKIKEFKENEASEKSSIHQLERSVQNDTKQIENLYKSIQAKQVQIGQMKEEQKQYKLKLLESQKLIDKLKSDLKVEVSGDKSALITALSTALTSLQSKFDQLKIEQDKEEKKLQDEIDKARTENAKIEQLISSKKSMINDYKNKLKRIKDKLDELDSSHTQLKMITDKIERSQKELVDLKNSFNEQDAKNEIANLQDEIDKTEVYLEKLDKEFRILQRNYTTEEKIESERGVIFQKRAEIDKFKTKHSQHLQTLFMQDPVPEKNLNRAVGLIQNQLDVEQEKLHKSVKDLEKELTTLESNLKYKKGQLQYEQNELSSNQRKIEEICQGKSYDSFLDETSRKKDQLQQKHGTISTYSTILNQFAKQIESEKCCPVCQTKFDQTVALIPEIVKQLRKRVSDAPANKAEIEGNLKREEVLYNKLQQLKVVYENVKYAEFTKIPGLMGDIDEASESIGEVRGKLAAEKAKLEMPQKRLKICREVIADAALFDQCQIDVEKAEANVEDLQRSIITISCGRSYQETNVEIGKVKGKLSNSKNSLNTAKNLLDQHRDNCQELTKRIQLDTQKQINMQKLVQEKPLLDKQHEEYKAQIANLTTSIEEEEFCLAAQKGELKTALDNKKNLVEKNRKIQDVERKKITQHHNVFSEIRKVEDNIRAYELKENDAKLGKLVEDLAELQVTSQNLEKNKSKILAEITRKKETLAKGETNLRALTDNVTLRDIRKQEQQVVEQMESIKSEIGQYTSQTLFEDKSRKQQAMSRREREIIMLQGQHEQMKAQYRELESEINKPEIAGAYNKHQLAYYELRTTELAIEDMKEFAVVLERSLLKFHESKMIQINKSIKTLWRDIYRGNDIDYIEIKTEETVESGGNRRNYNYRVVQVKNDIELEMRGRCSAGQKVLACLVIRMALAETFSINCGILALDEPTTNLDKENIYSLCDALCQLIRSREREQNFQLLVITHDSDFITTLSQSLDVDTYWQVRRDDQGMSVVERRDF